MEKHPFLRFINLVNFDQKIQSLENEKIATNNEILAAKKQEELYAHELQDMQERVHQLKKKVDEQELEMNVLDQQEKDKKKHLEHLADYKDYHAIKSEIETIQRLQVQQEQNVLHAWNQLENAQQSVKKAMSDHAQQSQMLHEQVERITDKFDTINATYQDLLSQRADMEKNVPAEWLEKYSMMRARVVDPVVEISHQSCSACSQMITSQNMSRARHGAIIQCQTCYRLLYAPEIMEKHTE